MGASGAGHVVTVPLSYGYGGVKRALAASVLGLPNAPLHTFMLRNAVTRRPVSCDPNELATQVRADKRKEGRWGGGG